MKISIFVILFLLGCNREKPLNQKLIDGNWKITKLQTSFAELPSYCSELKINTVFEFSLQKLSIFNNGNLCGDYDFKLDDKELLLFEGDMVLELTIISLNDSEMVLHSRFVKTEPWNNDVIPILESGYDITLSRISGTTLDH